MFQTSRHGKLTIAYRNRQEYISLKNDIFAHRVYDIELENLAPVIIDVGAYIGMSSMFFMQRWPKATVIAIEPNPEAVEVLRENILMNGYEDNIIVLPKALSHYTGDTAFHLDPTDEFWDSNAGFLERTWKNRRKESRMIRVETVKLCDIINTEVDLLKIDIEGSEQRIVEKSTECFKLVKNIILEFHPTKDQSLTRVKKLLEYSHKVELGKPDKSGLVMIYATRYDLARADSAHTDSMS